MNKYHAAALDLCVMVVVLAINAVLYPPYWAWRWLRAKGATK